MSLRTTHTRREVIAVSLTQRPDAGPAVLVANLAVVIPAPVIKTGAAIP